MVEIIKNSNLNIQAIIIAGGRGNRMGEFTKEKQKCMLEIDGIPILEHILLGLKKTFGKKLEVIIATGYRGEEVRQYFGESFEGMGLIYVHDERPLETRGRLMLAKNLIVKPFLFLAGDILTPNLILEKVVDRFDKEQSIKNNCVIGVISGAKDHSPALTHAILTVDENYLQNVIYPPQPTYNKDDLRESQRAIYSLDFLEIVSQSNEKFLSKIIQKTIIETNKKFGIESFEGSWAHYVNPSDLEKYKNLSF